MCYHPVKIRFQIKLAQNEAVMKKKSFMLFVFRNEVKRFVYKYIIALKIFENNSHVVTGQATFSNPRTSSVRWSSTSNVFLRILYRTKKAPCVLPDREAEEKCVFFFKVV